MRLGGDPVGRWGLTLLAVAGVVGVILAIHGWGGRGSGGFPAALPARAGATAGPGVLGGGGGPRPVRGAVAPPFSPPPPLPLRRPPPLPPPGAAPRRGPSR